MPLGLIFALKSAGGAIWRFLSNLSLWQAVSLALGAIVLLQHFQLADARHDRDAYKRQRDEYHSALDKLVAESKAQQKQVGRTITHYVTVTKPDAEKRAKDIENAPLPGNCRTPPQIMDLDI